MAAPRRVTVIDDAPDLLALFGDALGSAAHVTLLSGVATISEIHDTEPELLVIDLRLGTDSLPGWNIVALDRAHRSLRDVPVIVCSAALDQIRQHEDEIGHQPNTYLLPKPFSMADLEAVLEDALGEPVRAG